MSQQQQGSPSSNGTAVRESAGDGGAEPAPNILFFDNVVHYRKESTFSQYSSKMNLEGFKNFAYLLLLISVGRLVLENVSRYGFKANPIRWIEYVVMQEPLSRPTFYLLLALLGFALLSLTLERFFVFYLESMGRVRQQHLPASTTTFASKFIGQTLTIVRYQPSDADETVFRWCCMSLLAVMMLLPVLVVNTFDCNPYLATGVCTCYCAAFLKLYSFHDVNRWWRTGQVYGGQKRPSAAINEALEMYQGETLRAWNPSKLLFYPHNLRVGNLLRFLLYPTLCYQCNFPLKRQRDWPFLLRCLLELVFLTELVCVLSQQWVIVPLSENLLTIYEQDLAEFLLRWTKLSLATISIWLLAFYCLFQSWLNLMAEATRFADRNFYQEWWNSRTISEFWRNWNIPVHRWCKRHVYVPLLTAGYSRFQGRAIIFALSGLFHEYIISVPLRHFSMHFALGMSSQIFLEFITIQIHSWHVANAFVWCSLLLGQPLLIILYCSSLWHSPPNSVAA